MADGKEIKADYIVTNVYEKRRSSARAASFQSSLLLSILIRSHAVLARPGGNITGVAFQRLELAQKQVELLTRLFRKEQTIDRGV